jgi:hypothetical protein
LKLACFGFDFGLPSAALGGTTMTAAPSNAVSRIRRISFPPGSNGVGVSDRQAAYCQLASGASVCKHPLVDDAVARYRAASETNDIDALMETLAPTAELVSPLSGRLVFRGEYDLRILLSAIYSSIGGLCWHEQVGDGRICVVLGDGKVGPFKLGDAMVCELDEDGRISRIRPYLRPWLGLTFLALALGPKVGRHPGVLLRALRRR